MADVERYDSRTILLHWLSATAIVAMWLTAQSIDFFPRPERIWPISVHIALGLLVAALTVARIVWKISGARRLPKAEAGLLGVVAVGVHHLLYLLILSVLMLGVTLELIRGDTVFHLVQLPSIAPGNAALRHTVNDLHGLLANGLLILAGLHGAAALWHHVVKKDGVLERMRPAR